MQTGLINSLQLSHIYQTVPENEARRLVASSPITKCLGTRLEYDYDPLNEGQTSCSLITSNKICIRFVQSQPHSFHPSFAVCSNEYWGSKVTPTNTLVQVLQDETWGGGLQELGYKKFKAYQIPQIPTLVTVPLIT